MVIHLINKERNKKVRLVGFSFPTLIFGSFYFLFCRYYIFGLLSLLFEYWLLPIPGMKEICEFFEMSDGLTNILLFSRTYLVDFWPYLILVVLRLCIAPWFSHLRIGKLLKKKNGYLPMTEKDQKKLTKFSKRYEHVPVDPIYMRKVSFKQEEKEEIRIRPQMANVTAIHPDNCVSDVEYMIQKKNMANKQKQLNLLYERYQKGELSKEELTEGQKKILDGSE